MCKTDHLLSVVAVRFLPDNDFRRAETEPPFITDPPRGAGSERCGESVILSAPSLPRDARIKGGRESAYATPQLGGRDKGDVPPVMGTQHRVTLTNTFAYVMRLADKRGVIGTRYWVTAMDTFAYVMRLGKLVHPTDPLPRVGTSQTPLPRVVCAQVHPGGNRVAGGIFRLSERAFPDEGRDFTRGSGSILRSKDGHLGDGQHLRTVSQRRQGAALTTDPLPKVTGIQGHTRPHL
uniref:Uncharacterized protein n=1 Tax=Branchiostoma floridae TaxID=7739 RepID=C3YSV2_BRAFL|eukprot:XP_002600604.1 hypothetical protein BRAFLDRAFT_101620 [Branchiostoma floridae]